MLNVDSNGEFHSNHKILILCCKYWLVLTPEGFYFFLGRLSLDELPKDFMEMDGEASAVVIETVTVGQDLETPVRAQNKRSTDLESTSESANKKIKPNVSYALFSNNG